MPRRQSPDPDDQVVTDARDATRAAAEARAAEQGAPRPIGVPEGYGATVYTEFMPAGGLLYANRGVRTPIGQRPPTYYEGAELSIYSMTDEEFAELQDGLVLAGLLDPRDRLPRSDPDSDPTVAAFRRVLGYANASGVPHWEDALGTLISNGGAARAASASGGGRLPARTSNPDDLRRVFRAAVIDTLGQGWSSDDIDRLVSTYQGMERGFATTAEEMAMASAGGATPGTIEELPAPETFAIDAARQADPMGAQAQDFLGAANTFFELIGQWRPSAGALPGSERP